MAPRGGLQGDDPPIPQVLVDAEADASSRRGLPPSPRVGSSHGRGHARVPESAPTCSASSPRTLSRPLPSSLVSDVPVARALAWANPSARGRRSAPRAEWVAGVAATSSRAAGAGSLRLDAVNGAPSTAANSASARWLSFASFRVARAAPARRGIRVESGIARPTARRRRLAPRVTAQHVQLPPPSASAARSRRRVRVGVGGRGECHAPSSTSTTPRRQAVAIVFFMSKSPVT